MQAEPMKRENREVESSSEGTAKTRGGRLQKRSLETRAKLLAAAVDVFAEMGFKGATTREIVTRAGVSLASLPYHFRTKEELWKAAVDDVFLKFYERMRDCVADLPRESERLRRRAELREFVFFCSENPQVMRMLVHEGTRDSNALRWFVDEHLRANFNSVRRAHERFNEVLPDNERSGALGYTEPEQIYLMMLGVSSLPYVLSPTYRLLSGRTPTDRQLVERHADAVADLFYP